MKRLRKPPVKEVKTSEKEPLAEGLQIAVPTDFAGRRMWSRMSDEEVVGFAQKVVEEEGVTGRHELEKADRRLYQVLLKRGLLRKVGIVKKQRSWSGRSDEELVEFVEKIMEEKGITEKEELQKADSGLHEVLRRRGLLGEVGFEAKCRSWKNMSDEEVVEFVQKAMRGKNITGRRELAKADQRLYQVLYRRGLLGEVGFEEKRRKERSWKDMSDAEVVEFARKFMEENGITGRRELCKRDSGIYAILMKRRLLGRVGFVDKRRKERMWKDLSNEELVKFTKEEMKKKKIRRKVELITADSGLYEILRKRKLLDRVGFEEERRKKREKRFWGAMSNDKLIEFANEEITKRKITRRKELQKRDSGLYRILKKRGLLDRVGFEEKKKTRPWKEMSDEDIVGYAKRAMEEKNITSRKKLENADSGLYAILRIRGLLDLAFAHVEQQRTNNARDAVIDALTKFANEKQEVEVA